jgi:hypothetical protein
MVWSRVSGHSRWSKQISGSVLKSLVDYFADQVLTCEVARLGDVNCDSEVNLSDIAPFVLALLDPAGYAAQFPNCDMHRADCNGDASVDGLDIQSFVNLLVP